MVDAFASNFSILLQRAVLPLSAMFFAGLAAVGVSRADGRVSRRIRRASVIVAVAFLGVSAFAMTESESPQKPAEKGQILDSDYTAGFVLVRVGTDETFDFSPSPNAIICEEWRRFGAMEDRQRISLVDDEYGGYAGFPFGTNVIRKLIVFSDGEARVATTNTATTILPFKYVSRILPESDWEWYGIVPSQFWSCLTPSNSFVMTWQNSALSPFYPYNVQAELYENGDMEFRFDRFYNSNVTVSNVVIGALNGGVGTAFTTLSPRVTSFRFARLDPTRADDPDPDGDGMTTVDELFVHGTNPYDADSDHDGLDDYVEINETNTDPGDAYSADGVYNDGLAVALGGLDPFAHPKGSASTVLEHVFYTGTTNGVFSYPVSTEEIGVLGVAVSGIGSGRLFVGDDLIPLVGGPRAESRNTLLLAIGKGVRKDLRWDVPEGLDVELVSDDLMIGELPTLSHSKGWLMFPHTEAEIPCIHDLNTKRKIVSLVHSEKVPGLTAEWSSPSPDVDIDNRAPASAELTGRFSSCESRVISYQVDHPKRLNRSPPIIAQRLRFCPPLTDDCVSENGVFDDIEPQHGWCQCYGDRRCWCDGRCGGLCPCCACMEPDETPESESSAEYERLMSLPDAPGVLQLYGSKDRKDVIWLNVPNGEPVHCCECPDHWRTNCVSLAWHSPHLEVLDASGADFTESQKDSQVVVRGTWASYALGKESILFATNGVPCDSHRRYTVVGTEITSTTGVPMDRYNELNSSFGYPVSVCTNIVKAPEIDLVADVMLPEGVFRLALDNVVGKFELWLSESSEWDSAKGCRVYCPAVKLLDSETVPERYFTVRQWRKLLADRLSDYRCLAAQIVSAELGHCDLRISFACEAGENSVKSSASQRITSVMPPLLPDYNRDGCADLRDAYDWSGGKLHYFWANNDTWRSDDAFAAYEEEYNWLIHPWPITLPDNSGDQVVNGRNDLVNLCPFAVDLSPFVEAWGTNGISYKFYTDNPGRVRFVPVRAKRSALDAIVKEDIKTYSQVDLHSSPLLVTTGSCLHEEGYTIPSEMLAAGSAGEGAFAVEFTQTYRHELSIVVKADNDYDPLFSIIVPVKVLDVHDMYRWLNLEYACNEKTDSKYDDRLSVQWPDSEHADANVVFVHGYNMHPSEAWDWSQAMFKRLWWSGMDAGFTAVLWRGNESQTWIPSEKSYVTPNYHQNVLNAFRTASTLASRVNTDIPGAKKYMIAHSLGNMLVSAARQDYGLSYDKYFMLNAAVPVEAYDPVDGVTEKSYHDMTPKEWRPYQDRVRSTHWYELFLADSSDERGKLTWKGRFKNVDSTINFYSSRDEVVANGSDVVDELLSREFAWYNQEQAKGSLLVSMSPQAGWGFSSEYLAHDLVGHIHGEPQEGLRLYKPEEAELIPSENLMVRPFFLDFRDKQIYGEGGSAFLKANDFIRWYALSHGMPAESFATGANPVPKWGSTMQGNPVKQKLFNTGVFRNIDMATNCIPEGANVKEMPWVHSYFIKKSLFDTRVLYEALVKIIGSTKYANSQEGNKDE